MTFVLPQAFLLLVPAALVLWRFGLPHGPAAWLRAGVILAAIVAIAGPELDLSGGGRDVIVVVDRSKSMPAGSDTRAEELVRNVGQKRGAADRVGVVTFGREARIERTPSDTEFPGFQREVSGDGSDLAGALDAAADLVSPVRQARVLLFSDGLPTGADARAAARRLAQRGIPVDFRQLARPADAGDVAVQALELPSQVTEGEPFQFSATLRSTRAGPVTYVLRRGANVLARGSVDVTPGDTRLLFRDRLESQGIADYTLTLEDAHDAVPENDRGRGVLRVQGARRILVVRSDGRASLLVDALRASKLPVELTATPPQTLDQLDGVGVVVLENVPARALGEQGLQVLSRFVRDLGGGLLMTGGRHAFGEGGYHRSALDEVLPVSMELREEQRKSSIALGISLDRSGSMSVVTPEGVTKMELADEGSVAALKLLSKYDEAAVWAVDTRAHEVFPLTPVEWGLSLDQVSAIRSEGGGIYIGEALSTAEAALSKSKKQTRHLILFADANDSEEPADYRVTLARMHDEGITVSVIGLGTPADSDAALLKEVAQLGGGRIYFAERASELPRLFSEETIVLARSAFVDTTTQLVAAPDLALLGTGAEGLPTTGGYNLTYLRPRASVALRTGDDDKAPVLAFWPVGLGHAAAFTAEIDGEFSGDLRHWAGTRSLLARLVRELLPAAEPSDVLAKVRREGHELHVTVELDDAAEVDASARVALVAGDGAQPSGAQPLRWEDAHRLGARFPLDASGSFFPVVQLGGRLVRVAPATLPYAPEFEPRDPASGRTLLQELAQLTGGEERLSVDRIFAPAGGAPARRSLAPWIMAIALLTLLAEVAVRRLRLSWPRALPLPRRAPRPQPEPAPAAIARAPRVASMPEPTDAPAEPPPPASPEPPEKQVDPMQAALDQARDRARKRM